MTYPIHQTSSPKPISRRDHSRTRRHAVFATIGAMAVMAIILPGCDGNRRELASVTGKVTYGGKPLRFGTVIFEPEMGQYATGVIQPDGTFQMETRGEGRGVPVGKCKVRFVCFAYQDPAAQTATSASKTMQGEVLATGESLIPQKYLSSATSGITVDVKPDSNEPFVFELTGS